MTDITMPRLSDTMEEGVLAQWHKQVGDEVNKGATLADIETDKTTMELEAYDEGTLERLLVEEGETVPVGAPVAVIGDGSGIGSEDSEEAEESEETEEPEETGESEEEGESEEAEGDQPAAEETPSREEASGDADAERTEKTPTAADDREQPLFRSPLARKLARDNDIDLAAVTGTGPGGRIVRADVQEAIETGAARRRPAEPEPSAIEGTAPTAGLRSPPRPVRTTTRCGSTPISGSPGSASPR